LFSNTIKFVRRYNLYYKQCVLTA